MEASPRRTIPFYRNGLLFAAIFFAMIWIAYFAIERTDHQIANFAATFFALLTCIALFLVCIRRRWIPRRVFLILIVLVVVGTWLLAPNIEFRGFSGEMIPQFRWKRLASVSKENGLKNSDQQAIDQPVVDLKNFASDKNSNFTFTQFMGNDRDGKIVPPMHYGSLDESTTKVLWKIACGAGWSGFVATSGVAVTQEEIDGIDHVTAYRLTNGEQLWKAASQRSHYNPMGGSGPRATPTICKIRNKPSVIAQSSTGIVTAFDLATGRPLWSVDLLEVMGTTQKDAEEAVMWGRSGSPLVIEDKVIVPLGGGKSVSAENLASIAAFSVDSGTLLWKGGHDQISYSSPSLMTIDGVSQIVQVNESNVAGYSIEDGNELWKSPWFGESNARASVSQATRLDAHRLLLSKGYSAGSQCIEVTLSTASDTDFDVKTIWKRENTMKTKFMSPVYLDGHIYGLSDGILECIRAEDGQRLWKDSSQGRLGHGQLLLSGDQLICMSESGSLVKLTASPTKPSDYQTVQLLDGITWNPIAIVGSYVLARNSEHAICVELPEIPN